MSQEPDPHLLLPGYRGFNIVVCGSRYFALACDEGAFDLAKVRSGAYRRCFEGDSAEAVMKRVDDCPGSEATPVLCEAGYWGFNIVQCGARVFALAMEEGAFEIERAEQGGYRRCFGGASVAEVKRQVDTMAPQDRTPRLREAGYWGFNIIEFAGRVYALACEEGEFAAEKVSRGDYRRCREGASVADVKRWIDEEAARTAVPILRRQNCHGYNIIEYGTKFYGLPLEEGAFEYAKIRSGGYRHCVQADTVDEAVARVEEAALGRASPRLREYGYRGFNIIECAGKFYALAQTEGAFNAAKARRGEYRALLVGESVDDVKRQVAQIGPQGSR
jgi:hypothetical protein